MDDAKWEKYAALGGVAFVVLNVVGTPFTGAPPAPGMDGLPRPAQRRTLPGGDHRLGQRRDRVHVVRIPGLHHLEYLDSGGQLRIVEASRERGRPGLIPLQPAELAAQRHNM